MSSEQSANRTLTTYNNALAIWQKCLSTTKGMLLDVKGDKCVVCHIVDCGHLSVVWTNLYKEEDLRHAYGDKRMSSTA